MPSPYACIESPVRYFGVRHILECDARCDKAWGIADRPRVLLPNADNEDDFEYLGDNELGEAPKDPGTYECDESKPQSPEERHNKWCARACERAVIMPWGKSYELPDFSRRVRNRKEKKTEPWMSPQQERKLRKWPNWSGHFALGGFFALAFALKVPQFVAVAISIGLGAVWELAYWALTDRSDASNRASLIDWIFWIVGAVVGGVLLIYLGGGS